MSQTGILGTSNNVSPLTMMTTTNFYSTRAQLITTSIVIWHPDSSRPCSATQ